MKTGDLLVIGLIAGVLSGAIFFLTRHREPEIRNGPEPIRPHHKLQLVYVRGAKCAACDKMERTTFANPKVAEKLGAYDVAHVSGKDAEKRYGVTAYPTYILLTHDGKELKRGSGYRSPEEFIAWLGANEEVAARPAGARECCGGACACELECICP